ncbi:helix-turn-helix domain-containing protein [Spartinivicinus ruber]|uniref:helix-turn-helix domain-containing protein n=1 Tax=Spartinivicinus ruber TaxID=2683272 RepID=UPI0013D51F82|nr:helix-turn-helix transcriptional regulator [Spartinivicinus ruber]
MSSKFEELADIKEYDEIKKAIKNGETELVPDAVVTRLLDGENPVKVWREHRGLKQKQLAEKLEIMAAYLSQIEKGEKSGSVDVLKRIAEVLNVDLDDLM